MRRRGPLISAGVVALLVLALLIVAAVRRGALEARMLRTDPDATVSDPRLVRFAAGLARPAYDSHCASCHGARMQGDQTKGAPRLDDRIWLFGNGDVTSVERTILYGIRSGDPRSRNITDMPALGRTLQLTPADVSDVTTYVLAITQRQTDAGAIQRGAAVFQGKGVCYDCHSADAAGNPDYGAPAFTDNDWLYGGDRESVRRSINDGRHGLCPAWTGKLRPAVIRALAIYIHTRAQQRPSEPRPAHG